MLPSSACLDQLPSSALKDPSDNSSISELSESLSLDKNELSNISSPDPESKDTIHIRGRRKTRMAPPPPGTSINRSRSFNSDKNQNRIIKQGSTDSDSQVSPYLDLPFSKNKKAKGLTTSPRDKSRFRALKEALRSPRHIRKNSKKLGRESPSPSKARSRKITVVSSLPDNFTYGILPQNIDQDCEFQVKRIAEYDRYLQNLLAEIDPSHQDYKTLNNAVKRVNEIKRIADLESNTEVSNEGDTSDLSVPINPPEKSPKIKTLPNNNNNRREGSSAVVVKNLTVGSKFRAGSNWTQNMGWRPESESDGFGTTDNERMYVMEGPVQFTSGSNAQDRYLFLFSDILLVAKEKSSSTFKLKYRINVTDLWIACIEDATSDRSFVLGWTQQTNLVVATFNDANMKEMWLKNILERRKAEKAKKQFKSIASARQPQDTDDSEDEAYFEEPSSKRNTKSKKSPLLNIFKKTSREETNVNELTQVRGKLFCQPLEAVCTTDNEPPKHVLSMLEIVFREGTYTTGILRKSANARLCRDIKKNIDESEHISLEDHQVLAIGSVLKDYLRSIPKSLLIDDLYDDWMKAEQLEEKGEQIKKVKEILCNKLPTCHLTLLKYVICVLHHIDKNSEQNMMSAYNLAVCITPSLLKSKQVNTNSNPMSISGVFKVVQLMIENCTDIFGEMIVDLFGSSIGHKIRQDSDSDSMHSILSMQESTGGMRRDGSSIDSLNLVEGELYQGESSPKPAKSHLSPSNLSRDSGLTLSDSMLYDDDIPEMGHPDRKAYLRSISDQERSISNSEMGLYSRSLESTSSYEAQEPVAPPRKKKDFTSSLSYETFINYPRHQMSTYNRIGTGRAVRSHPDLGKRLSGDSLKSVEEAAEDMCDLSRTIDSAKFRDSEPVLNSREKMVRQKAISDSTPPLSPQSQSNSYFESSRDSLTSESSRSYDSSSLQSNQCLADDVPDALYTDSRYGDVSDVDSFASTIVVNHIDSNDLFYQKTSQNSSPAVPIKFSPQSKHHYPSSPTISVTQWSSGSDEKLDDSGDDDDFGFKKQFNTPPMELPQQRNYKSKIDKSYGCSPPPRIVLSNLKDQNKTHGYVHSRTQRRNSLDSISDFRIEEKANDLKHNVESFTRQRVTVIHRTHKPSPYVTDFVSMTNLSYKSKSVNNVEERTRPIEPPPYNEAVQRNFRILYGLPLEISDQDSVKQKEASARAKKLYAKSMKTYLTESDARIPDDLSSERSTDETDKCKSEEILAQINEDNDVYVTLSRNPKQIYEESIRLFKNTSASRESPTNPVPSSIAPELGSEENNSQNVNLHRSKSDVTTRPTSKLTIKLHELSARINEQSNQTQSTSCLEMNSQRLNKPTTQPPSYKVAISGKQQTIQDYTQPEATQIPVFVDKTESSKSQNIHNNPFTTGSKTEQVVSRRQRSAPKVSGQALPWSVSAMKQKWDTKGSPQDSSDSHSRKSLCPPPYQPPPPFKRDNSANRMSVSSNSSGGSFSSSPSKNNSLKRSGPQYVDHSFSSSSSEDLHSSGSLSHVRDDSLDSSDHDYTDVSYV